MEFISDHVHLIQSLVINNDGNYKPMVWASQVEMHASNSGFVWCPNYLLTPNISNSGYQWYYFSQRTLVVLQMNLTHIELAHRAGNHFDCIVDATTTRPCIISSLLSGKQAFYPHLLHTSKTKEIL